MNKLFAVLRREYLQAVKKKSFLIMTILTPFLMAALMFVPSLVAMKGIGKKTVAVVDATGRLEESIRTGLAKSDPAAAATAATAAEPPPEDAREAIARSSRRGSNMGNAKIDVEYHAVPPASDLKEASQPFLDRLRAKDKGEKLDGVLAVPADVFDNPDARLTYYSRSSTDIMSQERLGRLVGKSVSRERLAGRGLDVQEIERLLKEVRVDAVQVSRSGEEKKGGELTFLFGFLFVIMLFMPMILYGQEIMRGILQEKNERIVEILVSSMSPMQLLVGKVLGLAAVGLTQLVIWFVMGGLMAGWAGGMAMAAGVDLSTVVRGAMLVWFVVFFLLGYLIFVCVYAVGGAAVNSEKEAQQFLGPIMMVLMLPWFLAMPIIMNPESTLSTVLSLIPIYTPMTMFIRVLVSEPPAWQLALSVLLALGTIWGLFWLTAKIFRVGILSYGKRPTIPELWRWVKQA